MNYGFILFTNLPYAKVVIELPRPLGRGKKGKKSLALAKINIHFWLKPRVWCFISPTT